MQKTLWINAVMISGLLLAGGCASVNTVERSEPRANPNYVDVSHFETDPSLNQELDLLGVNEATLPDGTLKIQAEVYNHTRHRVRFKWMVEWMDESGMIIATPTKVWKQVTLNGRETINLNAVAPSTRAVDFRIQMKESEY
ncbi:MAG: YcfL family protein [Phycisphaeraceae bacterium]|nr:YcfL family protein [Phycisphaeraceae bacterium]